MAPLEIEAEELLAGGNDGGDGLVAVRLRLDDVHLHAARRVSEATMVATHEARTGQAA